MDCVLTGVGGQGTVLASRLIAQAAMSRNLPVRTAETIGMAQRGGSVVSHVRVGSDPDDAIASPLVPLGGADLICGFEPGETSRVLPYLASDGFIVVSDTAIIPVSASLGKGDYVPSRHLSYLVESHPEHVVVVEAARVRETCGSDRSLNVALIGAACACGALPFTLTEMKSAVEALVKPAYLEMNYAALEMGTQSYISSAKRWRS